MIRFNFAVTEAEAERIFDCITEEICKHKEDISYLKCGYDHSPPQHAIETIEELNEQIDFLRTLKAKILNTKE